MKETADFKVYTKGAGTGELKVSIKGPSELRELTWNPFGRGHVRLTHTWGNLPNNLLHGHTRCS